MKKAFVLLCSVSVLGGCARSPEARCGRGDGPACFNLGISYAEGEGVAQSWERAISLYEKACTLGVAGACTNLGASYARGNGVAQSWERANALYEKACGLGDAFGCANLGKDYARGRGAAQSWERANALYEKACGLGDQDSCQAAKDAKVAREDQEKLTVNRTALVDKAGDRVSPPTSRGPSTTEITGAPGTARWGAGGRLPVSRRAAA